MDSYIDIAFISLLVNVYFSQNTVTCLILKRLKNKKLWLIYLSLFSLVYFTLLILIDYIHFYHPLIILILLLIISSIIKFIPHSLVFITFFTSNNLLMVYLSKYLEFKNGIVIFTYPAGLYVSLIIPVSTYTLLLSLIYVKRRINKAKYIHDVIIRLGGNEVKLKGYLDSGNTLVVNNLPVIFISNKFSYLTKNALLGPPIKIITVNNQNECQSYNGEVIIKKKIFDVLIVVSYERNEFHQCECLLNLNLVN